VDVASEGDRRNFYFPRPNKRKGAVECKLEKRVECLIKLLFDMSMMNNQMREAGYDSKKMPLGKVAKLSIIKGYETLRWLLEEVRGKRRSEIINKWSSSFYTHIPHDFGMKNISGFQLDSEDKIKSKLEMLQSIEDIQIFTKLID
jgi:poly [ADP-ribose] polymerase 2/3/4